MTIDVTFRVDTSRLNRILRNLGKNANKAVRDIAFRVEAESKISATTMNVVDTGALRASIYTTIKGHDGYQKASAEAKQKAAEGGNPDLETSRLPQPQGELTAHVGPSVEYAIYQEFGTVYITGRPFMQDGVNRVAQRRESDPSIMRQVVGE